MYHDVKHEEDCKGMRIAAPEMRDCTCGKIIDCLLAERDHLRRELTRHAQEWDRKHAFGPVTHKPNPILQVLRRKHL